MAKDSEPIKQFKNQLKDFFKAGDEDFIMNDRTTDVIYKFGESKNDWLYFELKTTTREYKENESYFGAASLSQWVTANKHKGKYFFVLAYAEPNTAIYRFSLITPDAFISYVTGYYMHVDFNVPFSKMKEFCQRGDDLNMQLEAIISSGNRNKQLMTGNASKISDKRKDKIKTLKGIINSSK